MKKTTTYTIIGCNHRFTGEEETYCDTCKFSFKDKDCTAGIAVGERAYIYLKIVV